MKRAASGSRVVALILTGFPWPSGPSASSEQRDRTSCCRRGSGPPGPGRGARFLQERGDDHGPNRTGIPGIPGTRSVPTTGSLTLPQAPGGSPRHRCAVQAESHTGPTLVCGRLWKHEVLFGVLEISPAQTAPPGPEPPPSLKGKHRPLRSWIPMLCDVNWWAPRFAAEVVQGRTKPQRHIPASTQGDLWFLVSRDAHLDPAKAELLRESHPIPPGRRFPVCLHTGLWP